MLVSNIFIHPYKINKLVCGWFIRTNFTIYSSSFLCFHINTRRTVAAYCILLSCKILLPRKLVHGFVSITWILRAPAGITATST